MDISVSLNLFFLRWKNDGQVRAFFVMNVIDKKLTYNRSFAQRGKKQVHNLISFVVLHFVYMEKSNVERYYFLRIGCDFALSFCFGSCVPFIHVYWISPTFWISDAFMPLIYEVSNNPNVTTRHHVIQARIYESQTSLHSIKMDVSKILLGHFFYITSGDQRMKVDTSFI